MREYPRRTILPGITVESAPDPLMGYRMSRSGETVPMLLFGITSRSHRSLLLRAAEDVAGYAGAALLLLKISLCSLHRPSSRFQMTMNLPASSSAPPSPCRV